MKKNPYQENEIKISTGKVEDGQGESSARQKTSKRSVLTYVIAVILALICFLLGGMTMYFSLEPGMRTLLKVKEMIDDRYYQSIDDDDFYRVLFDAINDDVLDAYSEYMTADEFLSESTKGEGLQLGVGLVFRTQDANGNPCMFVERVCGNSPAEEAGIEGGSYVVGFGKAETEIQNSVVFSDFAAFIAPYGEGQPFYVQIEKAGAVDVVALEKRQYVENYVFYRTNQTAWRFVGNSATEMVEKGAALECLNAQTGYIRLTQFNGSAAEEFRQTMDRFKQDGKKHLILDLRGNGGGFLDIMQEISSYFCKSATEKKPVVAVAEYNDKKEKFTANGNYYYDYFSDDSRICVLADSMTASASECLIGCMMDYGTIAYGDICLSERDGVAKTYGKGIMQTTYPFLIGGDAIKLTTAKIVWPKSGHCIHGVGILPADGAITVGENPFHDGEIVAAVEKLFS